MSELSSLLLLTIVGSSVIYDIRYLKVGNEIHVLGWIVGLFLQVYKQGALGIVIFLGSIAMPVILFWGLFIFRMVGAADVKLFSVIGGFLGFIPTLKCIAVSYVCGAILSIIILLIYGDFMKRLQYFNHYIAQYLQTKKIKPYIIRGERIENIHFTVPILMGVILHLGGIY